MFSRFTLGTLRQWHWVSSAVCLVGMILFSFTGITLNHAADIPADPENTTVEAELSPGVLSAVQNRSKGPLPMAVRRWLNDQHGISTPDVDAEWDEYEVYLGMPKPGGDAWLSIDLETGSFIYEDTDRGVISYLNDLHKGRNTNTAWSWFIDIFSVLCLVFSLSGLWLLARYARQRPSTWPLVAFGVIAPIILLVLAAH